MLRNDMKAMPNLTIVSSEELTQLKLKLKAAGLDLCYTIESARPLRGSPARLQDPAVQRQILTRRPADPSYRIASVAATKGQKRFWPDRLTVTFHAVRAGQDRALEHYLATHPVGHRPAETVEQVETSEQAQPHDHHRSVKTYIQVALILALMTAVEVAVLYLPEGMRPPRWSLLIVLLLMSALKFGIVASFFMHLRYDSRLYTSFFVAGLVVAAGTMLVLMVLFYDPAPIQSTTHTPSRVPHALEVQPADRMAGNRALVPSG